MESLYIESATGPRPPPPASRLLAALDPTLRTLHAACDPPVDAAGHFDPAHPATLTVLDTGAYAWLDRQSDAAASASKLASQGLRVALLCGARPPDFPAAAWGAAGIALFACPQSAAEVVHRLRLALAEARAPCVTVHGVLAEVFGLGVLLTGPSGIGKSELALELLGRGHHLVADDAVEVLRLPGDVLVGRSVPVLQDYLEVRALGVLDVRRMYGDSSVLRQWRIDVSVHLQPDAVITRDYMQRLQGYRGERTLLDTPLPEITLPVAVGHNLATLVEAACRDLWLRLGGLHADAEFAARQQQAIARTPST